MTKIQRFRFYVLRAYNQTKDWDSLKGCYQTSGKLFQNQRQYRFRHIIVREGNKEI